ncbi:hypothetical protein BJ170DRAFT_592416 [Xylariales sp. AK1849]|nr:hypothetical protein BJ170DRAFT_592416 [Xylariales sp. AK1849]
MPLMKQTLIIAALLVLKFSTLGTSFIISFYLGTECHGAPLGGNHIYHDGYGCGQCYKLPIDTNPAVVREEQQDFGYDVDFWDSNDCNGLHGDPADLEIIEDNPDFEDSECADLTDRADMHSFAVCARAPSEKGGNARVFRTG